MDSLQNVLKGTRFKVGDRASAVGFGIGKVVKIEYSVLEREYYLTVEHPRGFRARAFERHFSQVYEGFKQQELNNKFD